jgi:hypothetical protein
MQAMQQEATQGSSPRTVQVYDLPEDCHERGKIEAFWTAENVRWM